MSSISELHILGKDVMPICQCQHKYRMEERKKSYNEQD